MCKVRKNRSVTKVLKIAAGLIIGVFLLLLVIGICYQTQSLLKDPDVQPVFRMYIENILATSELKILKRLAAVETVLGLDDYSNFEDEQKMSTPEQISLLSERIDTITEPVVQAPIEKPASIPTSKTEVRAVEVVEHLQNTQERNNEVFMTSREIMSFLKYDLPDECRIGNKIKNPRQIKKDVLEKAVEMYPDIICLSKKRSGNKNVRIVYKPKINISSLKRKLSVS